MNLRGLALRTLSFSLIGLFALPNVLNAGEIVSVYPTGSVKQVQQVVAKFSTDMVAMGDPRSKADPFKLTCNSAAKQEAIDGEANDDSQGAKLTKKPANIPHYTTRWADTKTWSLDFDKPLPAGVKCTLNSSDTTKDLAGKPLSGKWSYAFSTSGPALLGMAPRYGEIEPGQYFVLEVDGELNLKSVESNAYFEAEGIPDKIGVKVITGKDRDVVIRAAIKDNWNWHTFEKYLDSKKPIDSIGALKNFVVIAGRRRFPEGKQVTFQWPKGILSKSGLAVEEEQHFDFAVVPPFEVKFTCDRAKPDRPCNPILGMSLTFTRRLKLSQLQGTKVVAANGTTWSPVELSKGDQNKNVSGQMATGVKSSVGVSVISQFADKEVDALNFPAPFPEKTKFQVILPKGLKDEIGRPLINERKFPLDIATDEYSPLLKFASPFGLLELHADPALPVSVRNIEKSLAGTKVTYEGKTFNLGASSTPKQVIDMYHSLQTKEYSVDRRNQPLLDPKDGKPFSFAKPGGERDFEVVGIPFQEPGFHVVEFSSPRLGAALLNGGSMYVASGALVTNLSVHFKKGRESSAVWVTALDTSKPVSQAHVGLYDNKGHELAKGVTDAQGIWRVGRVHYPCEQAMEGEDDESSDSCEIFAFAKLDNDFSFTSSVWFKGIEYYRFNLTREYLAAQWGPVIAHTILDRAIMQAGETINMKHLLREHTGQGFRQLNPKHLPKHVLIVHSGSRKTYTLPFEYDKATGSALTTFKVPADASLGMYEVYLSNQDNVKANPEEDAFDYNALNTGRFLVSEYRLPLMEATVKIQGEPLVRVGSANVDLSANYLSGGPAKNLKVKVRAYQDAEAFEPDVPGASEFRFFATPTRVGTTVLGESSEAAEDKFMSTQDLVLDASGGAQALIKGIPRSSQIKSLVVEMEYRDPNGEIKTATTRKTIYPGEAIVGLRSDDWMSEAGKVSVQGIVTNQLGQILPNHAYTVQAFKRQDITHRKRLVGGFYAYDSKLVTTSLGQVCSGKSDKYGRFTCIAKNIQPGSVILEAKTADSKGRITYASVEQSVYGGENMWWTPSDSDRIDLIAEKTRYEPGEKAVLTVRSPFPKSTVLVTIEREGVLDAFVREITREKPTIEVPIKPNYGPNIFVSTLAVRGRVGEPSPTALVDLAKPAMKLGLTELKVGWKPHELKVTVTTDRKRYHVREKVQAKIHVVRADGKPAPAGTELAVTAVDEGLDRLRHNWSFDVLSVMMGQRGLAVDTSTSQNEVIGKRHFGSKAKPPGGGGGHSQGDDSRQFFDPLLLWSGRVKVDANGDAIVTIPLNDSITGFKIAAAATGALDLFGDGSTRIEASKDLILYSGFAPLVREGDVISNRFTLRNTTEKPMNIAATVSSAQIAGLPSVAPFVLAAGESKTLEVPVTVPAGLKEATFDLSARDTTGGATDAMKAKVKVDVVVPDHVLMATLFQIEKPVSIPVQQPSDALPNRGGVEVYAQDTLVRGLASVKSYMADYPYSCLEQKVSKALVLEDNSQIQTVIGQLPSYFDSMGLLKFFPSSLCGSVQLNRYILNVLQDGGYQIPEGTRNRALEGVESWLHGRYMCHTWWDSVVRDNYRDQERVLAMETLSRYKKLNIDDLKTIQQTPNLWTTEAVAAWFKILQQNPTIPKRDELLKQADNILHARVNYQGSLMNLQDKLDWEAKWMLLTSPDQEALSVFGLAIDEPTWQGDVGKMARGVIARLNKGLWDTTLSDAWAVTQLRRFSKKFEATKVTGRTAITAPAVNANVDWAKTPTGGDLHLPWPTGSVSKPVGIDFKHDGGGKPWMLVQTRSAIPLKGPWDLGYKIARKIQPVSQRTPGKWSDGDVVNVQITITAKYDQPWVVVRDPVPAGATHLGGGQEGGSAILDRAPKAKKSPDDPDEWPVEFEEKSNAFFTSYAAYLPKGTYRLNYRIRLNSSGTFHLPPSRVEAMYSPETFGESPNGPWPVQP